MNLYVDGALVVGPVRNGSDGILKDIGHPLKIGRGRWQGSYFTGQIDDVWVLHGETLDASGVKTVMYDQHMIAHYPFEERINDTVYSRLNGLTCTKTDTPEFVMGTVGSGIEFPGRSAQYVSCDQDLEDHVSNEVTVMGWVKPHWGTSASWKTGDIASNNDGWNGFYLVVQASPDNGIIQPIARIGDGPTIKAWRAGSDDKWIHVAMTYDGETVRLFVNGQQRGEANASGSVVSSSDVYIGRYLKGILDEVKIYDRAFTESQINNLYTATNGQAKWQLPHVSNSPRYSLLLLSLLTAR